MMIKIKNILREIYLKEYSDTIIKKMVSRWKAESNNTLSDDIALDAIKKFKGLQKNIVPRVKNGSLKLPKKFMAPKPDDPRDNPKRKPLDPGSIENYTWSDIETLFDEYGQTKSDRKGNDNSFNTVEDAKLVDIKGVPKIYEGADGIHIWEGSNYASCIKLNYAFKYKDENDKIQSYLFCIGRKDETHNYYYQYRFGGGGKGAHNRSFYYVADSTQSAGMVKDTNIISREKFTNWYHYFVIHAFDNGQYGITDTTNVHGVGHELDGNGNGVPWESIGEHMVKYGRESGAISWNKIKNLQDKFVYVEAPEEEVEKALKSNRILTLSSFISLPREYKKIYINLHADNPSAFTPEMFDYLIEKQDFELQKIAIGSGKGYMPTFNQIKDFPPLIKRYVQFQYTRGMVAFKEKGEFERIIPLPFVKYLNDDQKEEYLNVLEKKGLRFDLILDYFGKDKATEYADRQADSLDYLPIEAIDYISDSKLREFYKMYAKLFSRWQLNQASIGDLAEKTTAPVQKITPILTISKDWNDFSSSEKELLIRTFKKIQDSGNANNYIAFSYGMPIILEDQGQYYSFTPANHLKANETIYKLWDLMDMNGRVIKSIPIGNSKIMLQTSKGPKVPVGSTVNGFLPKNIKERIFPINNLTVDGSPIISLKESIYDDWGKYTFMRRAGILR